MWPMGKCKIANILQIYWISWPAVEQKGGGGIVRVYLSIFWLFGQVSWPNMAILKIGPYLRNRCS